MIKRILSISCGVIALLFGCVKVDQSAIDQDDYLAIKTALTSAISKPNSFKGTRENEIRKLVSIEGETDFPYTVEIILEDNSKTLKYISSTRINWIRSSTPELLTLFNTSYENVTDAQSTAESHSPENIIKRALDEIADKPSGYIVSRGNGVVDYISKDENLRHTEYRNTSNIGMVSVKLGDGTITLKVPSGSFSSTRTTSSDKELINQFYTVCEAIRKHRIEISQAEAKKRIDAAIVESEQEIKRQKISALKQQESIAKEKARYKSINNACIKTGHSGYHNIALPDMITQTQQSGGLENYINWVIDDAKEETYTNIKSIQVLDDAVLYSYYGTDGNFVVHVVKQPDKLYQEGQSLERAFYVFTGMYTYTSTRGARKKVPSFKVANIKL